jgi:hypothetical protein
LSKNENKSCTLKTSIGGQALIEGIMMRGPKRSAMAVRNPEGEIVLEEWDTEINNKKKFLDINGLKRYDEHIKSYIDLGNSTLASASELSSIKSDVDILKAIDHDAYITADLNLELSIKSYVDGKIEEKQDIISDLADIRSGAAAGATALQEVPEEYITETELANKEYATTSEVETLIDDVVTVVSDEDIDELFK